MGTSSSMDDAWLCLQLDHRAAHLCPFLQREANNTETVFFTMFFAFVIYRPRSVTCLGTCNMPWHEANRCSFWTSCTGVSRKRIFFSIMRNFAYNWLKEMRFLFERVEHTNTESTLKTLYLGCFRFSFSEEENSRLQYKGNHFEHVSWTLQWPRLNCAHSAKVKLLCQESFSCA